MPRTDTGTDESWSGRRESNPPSQLGKLEHYHYATPAHHTQVRRHIPNIGTARVKASERLWADLRRNASANPVASLLADPLQHRVGGESPPCPGEHLLGLAFLAHGLEHIDVVCIDRSRSL